jgi:UDP-glucose 4-epimerase
VSTATPRASATASWAGRDVAVLGGAGFIGSGVALRLASLGAKVTVVDGLIPGCGGHRVNLGGLLRSVPFIQADLTREQVPPAVLEASVIFDLMGEPAHARSLRDPRRDLECNLLSHICLLEALRAAGCQPQIVVASTRQVYGRARTLPVTEDHPTGPPDPNGIHKLAAEQYATLYGLLYGIPSVVLRLTNVYGPRQGNTDPAHGVTGFVIGQLLRGERVVLYGGGAFRRDWLFVGDAVDAMIAAAGVAQTPAPVYNIGHDRPASLREFVLTTRDILGAGDVREMPFPPELRAIDIGDYWTDPRRAEADLGWRASTPLAEGLRLTVDFYRSHPGGERWPS